MLVHLALLHYHVWIGAKTASSGSAGMLRLFVRRRLHTRLGHLRSVCGMCRCYNVPLGQIYYLLPCCRHLAPILGYLLSDRLSVHAGCTLRRPEDELGNPLNKRMQPGFPRPRIPILRRD